jgi:uncharacterized delta-60 repeat protein
MSARRPLRSVAALAAALLVGFLFSAGAQAAPGDLDTTFSGDGKQTTDFPFGGISEATATVRQPDGKIVAVGEVLRSTSGDSSISDFALARYNPDGTLDTSFSGDGKLTTDFGGIDDGAAGVALQSDGKVVVVGRTGFGGPFDNSFEFAVARYNPNGTLDTSFSGDGKQRASFGDSDVAKGVAVQGDGKIVAVGNNCNGNPDTTCDFALARFNSDGSLDTSFSGDGKQTADLGHIDIADAARLQADGKIVAVGSVSEIQSAPDFALARFDSNGSLDTTFSGDGKQTTEVGSSNDRAHGVAIQADGKIVAAGESLGGSDFDFALARYNPNGTLDTSFSGDGKQTTDSGGSEAAHGVKVQADGKLVTVGDADGDFALARYNPNGSLDTTFSGDGKQTTDFAGGRGGRAVTLQADNKIVAVGVAGGNGSSFALARYNSNGSLDTAFSGDGKQTTSFGGYLDGAVAVAIQANGRIVAVGHAGASGPDFAITRYNPNGSLDTTFSSDGKLTTDFGGNDGASAVAIQANGKIVAVGRSTAGLGVALARYNPNGSLDTTFSGDGKQTTDLGGFGQGANGVAIQADGKIVVVASACSMNTCGDFALARYNPNGTLDTSFSGDGKQTTSFGDAADGATGVAIQTDGRIIAVGSGGPDFGDFALARYNPNGSLDTSFSGDGKQMTDFGGSDAANAVALHGSKIVLVGGGSLGGTGGTKFALARYNPNGSLDTSFSGDGKQLTDAGNVANGVVIQPDGKIVAAGGYGFDLARYNPNGSLDTSFSGDGKQTTDFGSPNQIGGASGVALQGNGRIIAVGIGRGPTQTDDFALARYLGG